MAGTFNANYDTQIKLNLSGLHLIVKIYAKYHLINNLMTYYFILGMDKPNLALKIKLSFDKEIQSQCTAKNNFVVK